MTKGVILTPLKFIILLGIVSLFSDMTYEGARSITGPYMATLGANAAIVGTVVGFGEFVGYSFRLVSGYLSDRTGRAWLITLVGYIINLISIPLLAIATSWELAALFIVFERFGKGVRRPARDAMLSYATKEMGSGKGFGLHNALDRVGAVIGPLLIVVFFYYSKQDYRTAFACLAIPAFLALCILGICRIFYPNPEKMEVHNTPIPDFVITRQHKLYLLGICLVAAGFVDFALISYHFKQANILSQTWIPLFYAVAMGIQGLSSIVCGHLYDVKGLVILVFVVGASVLFVPLVFLGSFYLSLIGMALWGVGMGAQDTIMRAIVAKLTPMKIRGTAYGILNFCFGISWFLGSAIMGFLYDASSYYLIAFSLILQLSSIPIFLKIR